MGCTVSQYRRTAYWRSLDELIELLPLPKIISAQRGYTAVKSSMKALNDLSKSIFSRWWSPKSVAAKAFTLPELEDSLRLTGGQLISSGSIQMQLTGDLWEIAEVPLPIRRVRRA